MPGVSLASSARHRTLGTRSASNLDEHGVAVEYTVGNLANDDQDYVVLTGSQRIHPVPFSYWSAEGSDFRIDGSASVEGNLFVTGNISDSNS
ncbi:MAG: hypothetical protein AAFX99_03970, partial [Myxococcota bacterium]